MQSRYEILQVETLTFEFWGDTGQPMMEGCCADFDILCTSGHCIVSSEGLFYSEKS